MQVRKAVITAAGWGTRFLPITKAQPKEMLPLVTKPLIQYSVEEAIHSGIEQIIIITAPGKRAIKDYFDRSVELERFLERKGKTNLLKEVSELSSLADIGYVRQEEQLGLGHAILTAKDIVGQEPFAVLLPDDIIDSKLPVLKQLIAIYEQYKTRRFSLPMPYSYYSSNRQSMPMSSKGCAMTPAPRWVGCRQH